MKHKIIVLILVCLFLCSCQNPKAEKDTGSYSLATKVETGVQPAKHIPVPMPGQLMPVKTKKSQRLVGEAAIEAANKKAMKQPNSGEYINSIMNFDYMPGALYQIYCAPLSVTDVQFQTNEHIVAVGAGDTSRWQVSKSYSGIGASRQEHLFIKPMDEDLANSLVITTDLRTYHLMLHSTNKTYMASVAWRYPDSEGNMLTIFDENLADNGDIVNSVNVERLKFNYQVKLTKGPKPDWFPRMIFNDGSKTYIKFSGGIQETPNLFVGTGRNNQVVNFRVQGDYYVIDSVIYYAQLCSGETIVQISAKK